MIEIKNWPNKLTTGWEARRRKGIAHCIEKYFFGSNKGATWGKDFECRATFMGKTIG